MKKLSIGLVVASACLLMATSVGAKSLIVNGGFEQDTWGGNVPPVAWQLNAYAHFSWETETAPEYVHSGSQSYGNTVYYQASTRPALTQVFNIGPATSFEIKGWARTTSAAGCMGAVRVRENKLGPQWTVQFFNGTNWQSNASTWASADGFYLWDQFGMSVDRTWTIADTPTWTPFDIVVPALEGVTEYAIDLGSINFVGANAERYELGSTVWYDDISVITNINDVKSNVILSDYSGDVQDLGVKLEASQNGVTVDVKRVFLDANGNFELTNALPSGTYDLAIRTSNSLRKVFPGVDISDSVDFGQIILTNGDIDGDNEITSTDLSILGLNLGLAGD